MLRIRKCSLVRFNAFLCCTGGFLPLGRLVRLGRLEAPLSSLEGEEKEGRTLARFLPVQAKRRVKACFLCCTGGFLSPGCHAVLGSSEAWRLG